MKPWRSKTAVTLFSIVAVFGGYFGGGALLQQVQFAHAANDIEATRAQLQLANVQDLSTVFKQVGKVVEPSVVNIRVSKTVHVNQDFPKLFRDQRGNPIDPENDGEDEQYNQIGTGSGVIMEVKDGVGYILTNNHVAGGATKMEITLADGRLISDGKVVAADAKSDLAVVQIKADRLIAAKWGNSDELEKGDWVLAFGSPFGYIGSMTHGIVSATNRHDVGIIQDGYENFIQVDAPINPGNSGGPLVNIRGDVVGINTAIASRSGGFQGIGFAIPTSEARPIYDQIRQHGKVVRGWLGVSIRDVAQDTDVAKTFDYTGANGVIVDDTFPNTPATDKLQAGDIIVGFNSDAIDNVQQLRNMVAATAPDTKVTLKIFRDKKTQSVELTIGNQPDDVTAMLGHGNPNTPAPQADAGVKSYGMTLITLDKDLAGKLGIDQTSGAAITSVARGSVAFKANLRKGDVITMVGPTMVHTAEEATDAINKADIKAGIRLYIPNRMGSKFVVLQSDDGK